MVVVLLTCAFVSVALRSRSTMSRLWLAGWLLIDLHILISVLQLSNSLGVAMQCAGTVALANAGVLFGTASVPYRNEPSSLWMTGSLLATTALCTLAVTAGSSSRWLLTASALLLAFVPFAISTCSPRMMRHPLRSMIVCLYGAMGSYLLAMQFLSPGNSGVALSGILCTIYFGCALHIIFGYRRATTGTLITIVGFLAWAVAFALRPAADAMRSALGIENYVWHLPMYVVALGMILLMLEDLLEHSQFMALHDELTGLPNRRLFLDRLEQSIKRARRTCQRCALLVVDLNRFKIVNDTLGHHAGDVLLQHVSQVFSARVRSSDTVARTGGDEFSVILENPKDAIAAQQVADYLLEHLNAPLRVAGRQVRVGASVGIALYPEDSPDAEMLRNTADMRMYANKKKTRYEQTIDDEYMLTFPELSSSEFPAVQERTGA